MTHLGALVSVEPPRPCEIRDARECKVLGESVRFLDHSIKAIKLPVRCGRTLGRQGVGRFTIMATPKDPVTTQLLSMALLSESVPTWCLPTRRAAGNKMRIPISVVTRTITDTFGSLKFCTLTTSAAGMLRSPWASGPLEVTDRAGWLDPLRV